jgi:hypothetical protein
MSNASQLFDVETQMSAVVSDCERYRYRLDRRWGDRGDGVNFIMLNPSTADATHDDPTIRRCVSFAKEWGKGAIVVTNLFAFRATDPRGLASQDDPVGPENDTFIREAATSAGLVVCAWGAHGFARERAGSVLAALRRMGVTPTALRLTKDACPSHPLYLPAGLLPIPIPPPSFASEGEREGGKP